MASVVGLWSLVLQPGKTHTVALHTPIQLTNISFGAEIAGKERSVVTVRYPSFEDEEDEDEDEDEDDEDDEDDEPKLPKVVEMTAVIGALKPDVIEHLSVNITFPEDTEAVELSVSGANPVHLLGHYVTSSDFDQDPYSDSEDGDEFDSDDESIDSDLEAMNGIIGADGESEDDDEEEASRFEELKEAKKPKKEIAATPAATATKKRAAEDDEVAPKSEDAADKDGLSKNQKKKLAKKLKASDGSAVAPAAAAAAPAAVKKEEAPAAKKAAPTSQTLAGGLIITDAKKGDGPVAKNGKKVGMRYIGKLENGKIFDSNTKGAPLNFTLGRGEVIKGWDQGILGMAVGGERKLVIPAALAYGKKGTGGIPGNSTLHFDVKLVSIK